MCCKATSTAPTTTALASRHRWHTLIAAVLLPGLLCGPVSCGKYVDQIADEGRSAVTELNAGVSDGIARVEVISSVLNDALQKLPADLQDLVYTQLRPLLDQLAGNVHQSLSCSLQELDRMLRAMARGAGQGMGGPSTGEVRFDPSVCLVIDNQIVREDVAANRQKLVSIYGSGLGEAPLAFVKSRAGVTLLDVSSSVTRLHAGALQVALDFPLPEDGNKLVVFADADALAAQKPLTTIPILSAGEKPCAKKVVYVTPKNSTYIPPARSQELDWEGPVAVALTIDSYLAQGKVKTKAWVRMRTPDGSGPQAEGSWVEDRYVPESGWKVERILSGSHSSASLTYGEHRPFSYAAGEPAGNLLIYADHRGADLNGYSRVEVHWAVLRLELRQTNGCTAE